MNMDSILQILNPHNPVFYFVIAWAVMWKGIALWHAARSRQLVWYIILLLVNTVGILEIIYLIFFRKKDQDTTL
jgi:hypothetical protein